MGSPLCARCPFPLGCRPWPPCRRCSRRTGHGRDGRSLRRRGASASPCGSTGRRGPAQQSPSFETWDRTVGTVRLAPDVPSPGYHRLMRDIGERVASPHSGNQPLRELLDEDTDIRGPPGRVQPGRAGTSCAASSRLPRPTAQRSSSAHGSTRRRQPRHADRDGRPRRGRPAAAAPGGIQGPRGVARSGDIRER